MASHTYYPLLFEPVLKDYIWGGRRLATALGRPLPAGNIAESWEIAAHRDGTTLVTNGAWAGKPLTALQTALGLDLIGTRSAWAAERGTFPLLVKLLDAAQPLSVQVHPDDAYAQAHEGNELGKTEMWVVLAADPGAAVILGVTPGTTPERFREALDAGRLEPCLHQIPVQAGDFVNVPAGSLHAILGGLLLVEIQQNSNTTYRVYDWNRIGHDGQPRPLHLQKALDVINFQQDSPALPQPELLSAEGSVQRELLNRTDYFTIERITMAAGGRFDHICDGSTFEIWGTIAGEAQISGGGTTVALPAVRFTLLPAALGAFAVHAPQGATLLRAYVAPEDRSGGPPCPPQRA